MIYLSAGHHKPSKGNKGDPGAVSNGRQEADLTIIQRNLTAAALRELGVPFKTDTDYETLGQYLARVKKESNRTDVCVEYHFDAATPAATGCTAVIGDDASQLTKQFAVELTDATSRVLGIRNRGVIPEALSARGKLGFMRLPGLTVIMELGFITNLEDLAQWEAKKGELARVHARIIKDYEDKR